MEQQGPALYKTAKAILRNDEDVADAMQTWNERVSKRSGRKIPNSSHSVLYAGI